MAQDTAQADAALQNYYLPVVVEQINQRALLLFGYSPAELEAGMGHVNTVNGETISYRGITKPGIKAPGLDFRESATFEVFHHLRRGGEPAAALGGRAPEVQEGHDGAPAPAPGGDKQAPAGL